MKKIQITAGVSFILLIILISQILVQTSCANIIPPAGGPRDSLPPVVTNMNPKDSSKNFKDNRITISFDEYIDIQEVQKNLLVSPIPKVMPAVEKKLSSILIKLKDTLEPNTTYTFDFGNAIRDINEANILKNFSYIFTTGDYYDSLTLRGKVILAKNGGTDTTLTVMLHTNMTDSAIVKEKPRYATKLDRDGNFVFHNLPRDTFAIYAIDESSSYRFSGRDQLFAFADTTVMSGDTARITLYAFPDNEGAPSSAAPPRRGQTSKEKRLIMRTSLEGNQQDLLSQFEMNFDVPLKTFDTTKVVFASDSTFSPVTGYSFIQDSTKKKITLNYTWKPGTEYHLILDKEFAADTLGNKLLKSDTISFTSKKTTDYGSLKLKFRNIDMAKNPVVLFVQGETVVDSAILTTPDFFRPVFKPGDYELRMLYDDNKNGTWDPGVFFGKKKQPELVHPIALPITVKSNWENDYERDLNAAAPPPRGQQGQQPNRSGQQPRRDNNLRNPNQ